MTAPRYDRATLLPNGAVLITGGTSWEEQNILKYAATLASAELQRFGAFAPASGMLARRASHTPALNDGRVLITGGISFDI